MENLKTFILKCLIVLVQVLSKGSTAPSSSNPWSGIIDVDASSSWRGHYELNRFITTAPPCNIDLGHKCTERQICYNDICTDVQILVEKLHSLSESIIKVALIEIVGFGVVALLFIFVVALGVFICRRVNSKLSALSENPPVMPVASGNEAAVYQQGSDQQQPENNQATTTVQLQTDSPIASTSSQA